MDTQKMQTSALKTFAQLARKDLLEQVSSKLAFVLKPESSARREYPAVVKEIDKAVAAQGQAGLIDQVAYTWFNRFCALRFMDVNGYNRVGVVSPAEGQVQPEILAEAKSGIIDDTQVNTRAADQVRGLLNGSISSPDAQTEAYRLLIVGSCNALYERMPYLFERIQDFTELLMPDDLLSENSILANMRAVMTPEACQDVEIIGWLYQFYISEKKQDVFDGLKKNIKITAENIPAATQLFTPHWIVRYLVENSLGRLWLLNRPQSRLAEQMDYYIAPEEPEIDFLKIATPEDIRICDPAAGSGHMLTYAFDLLYAIYEEEGYDPNDIPVLILTNNLTGVEIDDRAGALAAFALEMKAAAKLGRRRFFKMDAKPNICVLDNISFSESEMDDVIEIVGKDLYTADLRETLTQFEQAKNFGSLIVPQLKDPAETARLIEAKDFSGDLLLSEVYERLVKVLRMAEALSPKYHVVVANPPYLDLGNMNPKLKTFVEANYLDTKQGLDSTFIEVAKRRAVSDGYFALITQRSWMFLSRLEAFRSRILSSHWLADLIYLGPDVFPEINGEKVQNSAFVFNNSSPLKRPSHFIDVSDLQGTEKAQGVRDSRKSHQLPAQECLGLPGSPLAFWASEDLIQAFSSDQRVGDAADIRVGLDTGDNARFLRLWHEVASSRTLHDGNSQADVVDAKARWVPHTKGGEYRKWFGNLTDVIAFSDRDYDMLGKQGNKLPSRMHYFREGVFYTRVSSGTASFRLSPKGAVFNSASPTAFIALECFNTVFGLLNSRVSEAMLRCLSPTLNFQAGEIRKLPISPFLSEASLTKTVASAVALARSDWDAYETSWDFTTLPLLQPDHRTDTLQATYTTLRTHWQGMTDEMQQLEEENNRIFIDAYGLQDELTPEVPIEEITLTCNPAYRYGIKKDAAANETRLRADTMAEFLSYAVGCMFGRYSLDAPGLILANQGERLEDYLARVPEPSFMPDGENVIPMIDFEGDWFEDDITERFKQFLRVTFGDDHYAENLAFIEQALGKPLQKYLVKDFYKDHVSRYKKRPIYWLFSSPKGTFNALIYMHRYTPSTVSVVLNEYLREFRTKLEARKASCEQISISASASQKEKTQALKMITNFNKAIDEVNRYERDVLYPLAGQNTEIDLDDGVKHNYPLFGSALKKVAGLS
ncbi:BREX-1 system adenine-specific DNA-methyltransferase PglX [Halomonas sp. LS-001]